MVIDYTRFLSQAFDFRGEFRSVFPFAKLPFFPDKMDLQMLYRELQALTKHHGGIL